MIVEGAYPYIVGGVSVWVHQLISNLSEFEFILWTVVPQKGERLRFKLPPNVVDLVEIPLSEKLKLGTRKHQVHKPWQDIVQFHEEMEKGHFENFRKFFQHFDPDNPRALNPENYFRDLQGWELLTQKYNTHHPISPFVKYYWAWRAAHIPLFQMVQAPIPRADVYHAVSTGYAGLLGSLAKVKKRRPFLLTEHGIYAKEREIEINQSELYVGYQKRMWSNNFYSLARLAYTHADKIIALFRKNQQVQIEIGAPPERTEVIPNGIKIAQFIKIQPRPHKQFNVGFVGRMVAIKDVKNFILASRIVKDQIPHAHFYLIGPQDEQADYFRELLILVQNLGLKGAVTFTGKVDVKKYFPILDVLCLTSIKEAQPLAIIEAMAAGVPVVATNVGDVADILQSNGIVVPPKNPQQIARGVVRFATDENFRQKCIQNGRQHAIREYDLDALIQRYGQMYRHYAETQSPAQQAV
jgi:glycosyltransferase involved in cell wall biosynthesis